MTYVRDVSSLAKWEPSAGLGTRYNPAYFCCCVLGRRVTLAQTYYLEEGYPVCLYKCSKIVTIVSVLHIVQDFCCYIPFSLYILDVIIARDLLADLVIILALSL